MRVHRLTLGVAFLVAPALAAAQTASLTPPPNAPPPRLVASGPHAVSVIAEPSLMTHTAYRPTDLTPFAGADRLPIIAWGNGACSNAGLLFSSFLGQIASHGFLVIASGPKDAPLPAFASQVPGQARMLPDPDAGIEAGRTTDEDLTTAIDWAIAENGREGSYAPVAHFLGGESDVAYANGKDDFERVDDVPVFLGSIDSGHGGTYMHPGGGWFGEVGVA